MRLVSFCGNPSYILWPCLACLALNSAAEYVLCTKSHYNLQLLLYYIVCMLPKAVVFHTKLFKKRTPCGLPSGEENYEKSAKNSISQKTALVARVAPQNCPYCTHITICTYVLSTYVHSYMLTRSCSSHINDRK